MSQDNSIQSKEKQNNTIENISSTNLYFNNIINNFNCNIDESSSKDKRVLSNEISNETLSYDLHNTYQQKEFFLQINSYDSKNIETFIHLLYNELMKEMNINTNLEEELNKVKNLLNNNKKNSFELIFDIFKKSIKKLIREKTKEILDSLNQCISNLLLLEQRNKYFIQQNFLKQTKIDILENEIDTYMEMEEEFDEMKEKLKYENGKFLHNEKKENEILILRAENSNLKKIIDKNEKTIEEKDHLIESIKKQSASMINTNTNTLKNSFELNEAEHNQQTSSLIFIQNSQKTKYNHNNNSNITNFKYNIIQKIKSPNNGNNYKTNNKSQSTKIIKFENNKSNNNSKNKTKILGSRASTKELISKKIKNKVLNMKKIRRINESCLDNYNKSSAHITNSLMSNRSNNSSSKRLKKNINSFFKNKKKTMFNGINRIHKKTSSGLTNSNINNIIKSNNNKIIVNSILDNNNNSINNNNSFFFKTTRKKFGISKKNSKTNVKHQKEDYLLIRNNNSLIKSPTTFNNDIDNCVGVNNNIIINNIIQNSTSMPISEVTNKSKEKINISENEHNKSNFNGNKYSYLYVKKEKNLKNKTTGFLSVNVKKKNE
jgi:hypothetical protein